MRKNLATAIGRLTAASLMVASTLAVTPFARAESTPPTITSDLADYAPGSPVVLTGNGWQAGEAVHITVNDDAGQIWSYAADQTADETGSYTLEFSLPNQFIAAYSVLGVGSSGSIAILGFTDSVPQSAISVTGPASGTFGDTALPITFTGGSGTGAVTYSVTAASDACVINATNPAAIDITKGSGTCTVKVVKAASGTYGSANATLSVTLARAAQTPISVTGPGTQTYGAVGVPITFTGGSGTGAVTYSVTAASDACAINPSDASAIDITSGTGTCIVVVIKARDANYLATFASLTVGATKASSTPLSISAPTTATFGQTAIPLSTSGGSGDGAVTFSVSASSDACTINPQDPTALDIVSGTGTCIVKANKAADSNFLATTDSAAVRVGKAAQEVIQVTGPVAAAFGATAQAITFSGGSGTGSVTYSVTLDSDACVMSTTSPQTIDIIHGSGTCRVRVTKAADRDFVATTDTLAVSLTRIPQDDARLVAPSSATYGDTGLHLELVDGLSSGATSYTTSSDSDACSVSADDPTTLVITHGSGTCIVKAVKAGDPDYLAAFKSRIVQIHKAPLAVRPESLFVEEGTSVTDVKYSVVGFVNGENAETAHSYVAPTCTSDYAPTNLSGSTSTVTCSGGSADDYDVDTSATASITVMDSPALGPVITPAAPSSGPFCGTGTRKRIYCPNPVIDSVTPVSPDSTLTLGATAQIAYHLDTTNGVDGGAVSFRLATRTTACSISDAAVGTIHIDHGSGLCAVRIVVAGDDTSGFRWGASEMFIVNVSRLAQDPLTVTAPSTATYGDSALNLSIAGGSGSGATTFSIGASDACTLDAGASSITITKGSGTCTVTATKGPDIDYYRRSKSVSVSLTKFSVGSAMTGNGLWPTGTLPSSGSTNITLPSSTDVHLTGKLSPSVSGRDVSQAAARFLIYSSSNTAMTTPDFTCAAQVTSDGTATCTQSLSLDTWTTVLDIPSTDPNVQAVTSDPSFAIVYQPTKSAMALGQGRIPDASSVGPLRSGPLKVYQGNFGFMVKFKTATAGTGVFNYSFLGNDGYTYVFKATKWNTGNLAIVTPKSQFTGSGTLTRTSFGNKGKSGGNVQTLNYIVNATDGNWDQLSITLYNGASIYYQNGVPLSQIPVSAGLVAIR